MTEHEWSSGVINFWADIHMGFSRNIPLVSFFFDCFSNFLFLFFSVAAKVSRSDILTQLITMTH